VVLEQQVRKVLPVQRDLQAILASKEVTAIKVSKVPMDWVVRQVLLVFKEMLVLLVILEVLETQVKVVILDQLELLELWDLRVFRVCKDCKVRAEQSALRAYLEIPVPADQMVSLVNRVPMGRRE